MKTIKKFCDKISKVISKQEAIYAGVCFAIFILLIILQLFIGQDALIFKYVDLNLFFTVFAVFILNSIASAIAKAFRRILEDKKKLSHDYDALCKMYCKDVDLVKHKNLSSLPENIKKGRSRTNCKYVEQNGCDSYTFPTADVVCLEGKSVNFNDSNKEKMYRLPMKVERQMGALFKAHSESKLYNQLNIRCDLVQVDENAVNMSFSRTTYLHSLLTNRAMDYEVDGIKVRDLYAYGPYLIPLEKSKLSNHVGYNGVIQTNDNYFIFIRRHNKVSVAKKTLQVSVTASLKSKFALNENGELTKDGLVYAIKKEIEDELNLEKLKDYKNREKDIFSDFSFENILYFYRELVEGGKPQFLFYSKLNISSDELKEAYTSGNKRRTRKDVKGFYPKVDGYKMLLIHRDDMKKIYITPDGITINGKFYKAVSTVTSSLSLIVNHLNLL